MRDKDIVARSCGYVVTAPSEQLLADVRTCRCATMRWDGRFLICPDCSTAYGIWDSSAKWPDRRGGTKPN